MPGLVVDLFAGGGGASVGIEAALGRSVDIAINHDAVALAVHEANHPHARHFRSNIWEVDPKDATRGEPVDVLWASPDCTHFSVAKGGKPRKKNIRSLAWVVVRWAQAVKPKVIFLENVGEFRTWGPLDKDGKPDKARMGVTFRAWKRKLERLGYAVDYRICDASQYGAPTRRRRLFLVARCDGEPIRWPDPTHGPGRLPLHTAAECIDWSIPCPSIFERKKPLAEKTLWRIAQGIRRFVLENPRPFIVKVNHGNDSKTGRREHSLDEPLTTVHAGGIGHAVVVPHIVGVGGRAGQSSPTGMDEPLGTITAKNDRALITPTLVTIDNKSSSRGYTGPEEPLPTTTVENRHALVAPTLIQTGYGERPGQRPRYLDIHQPLGTMVDGQKHALCAAFLAKHFGGVVGQSLDQPASTITAQDHHAAVAATLLKMRGENHGAQMDLPLPTVTAGGNHIAEVRAFLVAYYGCDKDGQDLQLPLRTVTTKDRLGLVTVEGVDYVISDIGMRMLEPHELLRAQFGRFAATYDLSAAKTKTAKVRLIGNSVCPENAEAIVRANVPHLVQQVAA
jgi:DNA (cytosine-5)-methyltransferase 1